VQNGIWKPALLALVVVTGSIMVFVFWPRTPAPSLDEPVIPVVAAPTPAPISPVVAVPDPPAPARPQPELPGAIGVIVENSFQSRPQVGLDKADLVYEMEAEYGITRFLALFHTASAAQIGPVRSARLGTFQVATAYGIPYAHAGGSNDALLALKAGGHGLLDLDEIYTCSSCFWRSSDRVPPHNLYTNTDLLVSRATQTGHRFKPLHTFSEGSAPTGGMPAPEVALHWGADSALVGWVWEGQRYQRTTGGTPHLLEGGVQIATDNLVVIFTTYRWNPIPQWGQGQNEISIVGKGSGYLFRDGLGYPLEWSKAAQEEHYQLTNPDGSEIQLAAGQTWFHVLKQKDHVTKGAPE